MSHFNRGRMNGSDNGPLRHVTAVTCDMTGYRKEILECGHTNIANPNQPAKRRRCGMCKEAVTP